MRRLAQSQALRQGGAYGIVGLVQLLVDWLAYVLLTWAGVPVAAANVAARACGATLGFTLNGAYTFRGDEGARLGWPRLLKFLAVWGVMTVLSTLAMAGIEASHGLGASWLAKPLVDLALAVLSFLASRHWIYR